jgi:hypothetical protein
VKFTDPDGFVEPVADGVTVAVKVTDWLTMVVEDDATTAVVVAVSPTDWGVVPVLDVKFVSPVVYAAVMT